MSEESVGDAGANHLGYYTGEQRLHRSGLSLLLSA